MKGKKRTILVAIMSVLMLGVVMRQSVLASDETGERQVPISISTSGGQWAIAYNEAPGSRTVAAQETHDSGFIVTGRTGTEGWVLKLNSAGAVVWQKKYADSFPESIQETSDGGYIVAGTTPAGNDSQDGWLLKLDDDGSTIWQKAYDLLGYEQFSNVRETGDGGYIVVGQVHGDVWVLRLDHNGAVTWQHTFDYRGYEDLGNDIEITSDGGFVVVGAVSVFPDYYLYGWILKFNSDGSVAWQNTYGAGNEGLVSIQETSGGGYVAAGSTNGDSWVLKLNGDGTILWQKAYDNLPVVEGIRSIEETSDGGYIAVADATEFGRNAFILKLRSDGTVAWQKTYGLPGHHGNYAHSAQETSDGGYIVAGAMPDESANLLILKLDSEGNIANCDLLSEENVLVAETSFEEIDSTAIVRLLPVTVTDATVVPQNGTAEAEILCSVVEGCALEMGASHNGSQLVLDFNFYTGPEPVVWNNSVNVLGDWISLWTRGLPAEFTYQDTIAFNFPHYGTVAVFSGFVTAQGIACASFELVDTGALEGNGERPTEIEGLPTKVPGLELK